jgi:hypothetical protein
MEVKSEDVTRSARFRGSNAMIGDHWRKQFSGVQTEAEFRPKWCSDQFSGVQTEPEFRPKRRSDRRGFQTKKKKRKFRGPRKEKKGENNNPEWMCGDQAMVIPELPFILVSRSTLFEFVSSPMLTGVVNYFPDQSANCSSVLGIQSLFILIIRKPRLFRIDRFTVD